METTVKPRVLFAVTGSVATIKVNEIILGLLAIDCDVVGVERNSNNLGEGDFNQICLPLLCFHSRSG